MNELAQQKSVYLKQHANNPINWKAYSQKILDQATAADKLIVFSIGYAACHWCHVMEHESFENQDVAALMNQHFISVKIDREEHPDIDAAYMKAVQLMTQRGGWPLNVVTLPDGRPIWGGTYFRTEEWTQSLEQIAKLYQNQPAVIFEYAEKLEHALLSIQNPLEIKPLFEFPSQPENQKEFFAQLLEKWSSNFDHEWGGMDRAPKFPMPSNYKLLLEVGNQFNLNTYSNFALYTLKRMALGGIYDAVAGGFSRYSVDHRWHVPHFEKMLYDNAQLLSLCAETAKQFNDSFLKRIAKQTTLFLEENLKSESGLYFAALDADSLNASGTAAEGAFYTWTKDELQHVLGESYDFFSNVFHIDELGYWEDEHYVLFRTDDDLSLAHKLNFHESAFAEKLENSLGLLKTARKKRSAPVTDTKKISSWNAQLLSAYCKAATAFGDENYLQRATDLAFALEKNSLTGNRVFRVDTQEINGCLEDYAFVIEAFLDYYQLTANENFLRKAIDLCQTVLREFDHKNGIFFKYQASATRESLVHIETEDNVINASNSVHCRNLFRLGIICSNNDFLERANKMLEAITVRIDYPGAYANWLSILLANYNQQRAVIVSNPNFATKLEILENLAADVQIIYASTHFELPQTTGKYSDEVKLYSCSVAGCDLPVTSINELPKDWFFAANQR